MPRQPPGKAALKTQIRKQLAWLQGLLALAADDWNNHDDEVPDLQLPAWPGWIAQVLADLVLLQPLDPLAALRGLDALNGIVGSLDTHFPDTDDILSRALLQALGRDGRVAVERRLVRLGRAGAFPDVELAWRATGTHDGHAAVSQGSVLRVQHRAGHDRQQAQD